MSFIAKIITAIVLALIPSIAEELRRIDHEYVESKPNRALAKAMLRKLKRSRKYDHRVWMIIVVLILSGCAIRASIIQDMEPMQLRADVRNAKVWEFTENGREATRVTLPAGIY